MIKLYSHAIYTQDHDLLQMKMHGLIQLSHQMLKFWLQLQF